MSRGKGLIGPIIEVSCPYLHEEEGDAHLQGMLLSAISTIYHSPLCDGEAKKQSVLAELVNQGILKEGETPPPVHINAPLKTKKADALVRAIRDDFDKYQVLH